MLAFKTIQNRKNDNEKKIKYDNTGVNYVENCMLVKNNGLRSEL